MNPPQVYMCSPSWTLLPPPSPFHPSGSSQCFFKSEFCNKELMIWVTVSSRSCFYWLYRASPSSTVKNKIGLILVLTIYASGHSFGLICRGICRARSVFFCFIGITVLCCPVPKCSENRCFMYLICFVVIVSDRRVNLALVASPWKPKF